MDDDPFAALEAMMAEGGRDDVASTSIPPPATDGEDDLFGDLEAMLADDTPAPAPAPIEHPPESSGDGDNDDILAELSAALSPSATVPGIAPTLGPAPEPINDMRAQSPVAIDEIATVEKARLAAIDVEMGEEGLKDRKRQALLAERIKLVKNEEERQQERKFRDLLRNDTMTTVLDGLRDTSKASAVFEAQQSNMQLMFAKEEGRGELAHVLGRMEGVQVFPTAGFQLLSQIIEQVLNQMVGTATPLFDDFIVCASPALPSARPGTLASLTQHTRFPHGITDKKGRPRERPDGCEHFCYPVDPKIAVPPPLYTVVRTLDDGARQYGFCKPMGSEVICLLSRHPWFELFETVMGPVGDAYSEGGFEGAVKVLDVLFDYASNAFPMPGERFKVAIDGYDSLYLTRPDDEAVPLVDADCSELFMCIGVDGVLTVFKSMLSEGHCVFVSNDFRRLGICAQAAASLLYPFTWQQIFVPILPRSWIDYITAPMPFICGVHDSMFDEVLEQPIEDAMVFAQLDKGEMMRAGDEQGCMPLVATAKLEKAWTKLLGDLKKQKIEPKKFNHAVREATIDFMISAVGNYREFMKPLGDGEFDLNFAEMVKGATDESDADFIRQLEGAQMFDIWCRERMALAKEGYPRKGLFESKVSDMSPADGAGQATARQDVTTTRMLVNSSRNIRADDAETGKTMLDDIRSHSVWKRDSLWFDVFEDSLHASGFTDVVATVDPRVSMAAKRRSSSLSGAAARDAKTSQELSNHMLKFSEIMMEFGVPLNLVMKFTDKAAKNHHLDAAVYGTLKDTVINDLCPRFAHLQEETKSGWLEVEGKKNKFERKWFVIRGTSLCVHDSNVQKEPTSVIPCGACEVLEPKNKRKGHDHLFRINVAAYAVGSSTSKSGSVSKRTALKFIVDAPSSADRVSWYKAFDNGGASIPDAAKKVIDEERRQVEEAERAAELLLEQKRQAELQRAKKAAQRRMEEAEKMSKAKTQMELEMQKKEIETQGIVDAEKARLAAIDVEMGEEGLKDRKRQALLAERIKLVKNEEERQQERKFRDLLRNDTMTTVLDGLRDTSKASAVFEAQQSNMQLMFAKEEGRGELAHVLGRMEGVQVFPTAGFQLLSQIIEQVLNQMVGTATPLFDDFIVCASPALPSARPGTLASLTQHTRFPHGITDKKGRPRERPDGCEHFCYPVDPKIAVPPPLYTVVRTLDDGARQYGFCKPMGSEVICLLSRHPWFELFETVMGPVGDAYSEGGFEGAVKVLDVLFDYASNAFPMPGERFKVAIDGYDSLYLTRPDDEAVPLVDADCSELFMCIGVDGVLTVFKSMLSEGHCVFVSNDFRRLGICAQAAASLLYPFTWQQIFVPILPRSWIDYITAPMPFICGVHDSMFDEVLEQPIEDAMVFAQLDKGEMMRAGDEQGCMPLVATAKLEKAWTKLLGDLKKQKIEPKKFNHAVREATIDFMISAVGNYREFMKPLGDGEFDLNFAEMVKGATDESDADFIRQLEGAQMFDIWCRERMALAKEGYPRKGLFESKVSDMSPADGAGQATARQDVTTTRMLVNSSRNIRADDAETGKTLMENIRSHELWKKSTVWFDVFEDELDEGSPLSDQVLSVSQTMLEFGVPMDLVMKFMNKAADRHQLGAAVRGKVKDTIMNDLCPRFVYLQDATKSGWLEVEGKKKWERKWYVIRGTSLCVYDNDQQNEPTSVLPCGACEVLEPKSKRKGHDYVFRINVAEYAVGSKASGSASKNAALKFIVDAGSAADRVLWYKAFDNAGATIPEAAKQVIDEERRQIEEAERLAQEKAEQQADERRQRARESLQKATSKVVAQNQLQTKKDVASAEVEEAEELSRPSIALDIELAVGATVEILALEVATTAVEAAGMKMNVPRKKRCGTQGELTEVDLAAGKAKVKFTDHVADRVDTAVILFPTTAMICVAPAPGKQVEQLPSQQVGANGHDDKDGILSWLQDNDLADIVSVLRESLVETILDLMFICPTEVAVAQLGLDRGKSAKLWSLLSPMMSVESEEDHKSDPAASAVTMYRALKAGVIRAEFDKGSTKTGDLHVGELMEAYEGRLLDGQLRIRIARGWVSEKSGKGTVLMAHESGPALMPDADEGDGSDSESVSTSEDGDSSVKEVLRYKALAPGVIRAGMEKDSAKKGSLSIGEIIDVVESVEQGTNTRVRFDRGWASTVASSGKVLLERVQDAGQSEDDAQVQQEAADAEAALKKAELAAAAEAAKLKAEQEAAVEAEAKAKAAQEAAEAEEARLKAEEKVAAEAETALKAAQEAAAEAEAKLKEVGKVLKYKALAPGVIRAGMEKDSAKKGSLSIGEIIDVVESVEQGANTRVRFDRGWASTVASSGKVLLERVQDAGQSEDDAQVQQEAADAEAALKKAELAAAAEAAKLKAEQEAAVEAVAKAKAAQEAAEAEEARLKAEEKVAAEAETALKAAQEAAAEAEAKLKEVEKVLKYKALAPGVIRAGMEKDSAKKGSLSIGEIIDVVESVEQGANMRVHFDRGWASTVASSGKVLLERVREPNDDMAAPISLIRTVSIPEQKVVFMGDVGVGKSSLLRSLQGEEFISTHTSTVGLENCRLSRSVGGVTVKLRLWDRSGEETYGMLSKAYMKAAAGALIVYDVTSRASFDHVAMWAEACRKAHPACPMFLCGNKADSPDMAVSKSEAEAICQKLGFVGWIHVSAKSDSGITDAIDKLAVSVILADESLSVAEEVMRALKEAVASDADVASAGAAGVAAAEKMWGGDGKSPVQDETDAAMIERDALLEHIVEEALANPTPSKLRQARYMCSSLRLHCGSRDSAHLTAYLVQMLSRLSEAGSRVESNPVQEEVAAALVERDALLEQIVEGALMDPSSLLCAKATIQSMAKLTAEEEATGQLAAMEAQLEGALAAAEAAEAQAGQESDGDSASEPSSTAPVQDSGSAGAAGVAAAEKMWGGDGKSPVQDETDAAMIERDALLEHIVEE
eukprot:SAG11_NODE_125_length_15744_cov_50.316075_1_plen_2970_part_10